MTVHGVGIRRVLAAGLVSALTFAGAAPAHAAPPTAPPTGSVSISVVAESGTGCEPDAAVFLAPDSSGFVLDRVARARAGASGQPARVRTACRTNLSIRIPAGYSYAVQQVEYRGLADLAGGATAALRGRFSFPELALPARGALIHRFTGPLQDSWEAVDAVAPADLAFVPCGRSLTLRADTTLRVSAGATTPGQVSTLTLGEADPWPPTIYRLTWRTCS